MSGSLGLQAMPRASKSTPCSPLEACPRPFTQGPCGRAGHGPTAQPRCRHNRRPPALHHAPPGIITQNSAAALIVAFGGYTPTGWVGSWTASACHEDLTAGRTSYTRRALLPGGGDGATTPTRSPLRPRSPAYHTPNLPPCMHMRSRELNQAPTVGQQDEQDVLWRGSQHCSQAFLYCICQ